MRKSRLLFNKPVYTGMTILDNSKILMYDFFYNHLKKQYGKSCDLLYTDTDSLLLEIKTDDVYKDIKSNEYHYDTSGYPKYHPLHSTVNKKVLGKMKDECAGTPITKVVCLRSKMYSVMTEGESKKLIEKINGAYPETTIAECVCEGKKVLKINTEDKKLLEKIKEKFTGTEITECECRGAKKLAIKADEKNIRKAKGVKKSVIKKQIKHEQYKTTLFGTQQMWHGMNILRSEGHEIYGMNINKISLSPFDSKRWIADDGVNTKAYGYTSANAGMEEIEALFATPEMKEIEALTNTEIREMEEMLKEML